MGKVSNVLVATLALLLGLVFLVAHYLTDSETPEGYLSTWAEHAETGDLVKLDEYAPILGRMSDLKTKVGIAYRGHVTLAIDDVASIGALRALIVHNKVSVLKEEGWNDAVQNRYRQRPIPSWQDMLKQTFVYVKENLGEEVPSAMLYQDGNGRPRTAWNDVASAGNSAWQQLSSADKEAMDQNLYWARKGTEKLNLSMSETKSMLVEMGKSPLTPEEMAALREVIPIQYKITGSATQLSLKLVEQHSVQDWADVDGFVAREGPQMLSKVYQHFYRDDFIITDLDETNNQPGSFLFREGRVTIFATAAGGDVEANLTRNEGRWKATMISDILNVVTLVGEVLQTDGQGE